MSDIIKLKPLPWRLIGVGIVSLNGDGLRGEFLFFGNISLVLQVRCGQETKVIPVSG